MQKKTFNHHQSSGYAFFPPLSQCSTLSYQLDTLPTEPRTSAEEQTACLEQSGDCTDAVALESPRQEETEGGWSKDKANAADSHR